MEWDSVKDLAVIVKAIGTLLSAVGASALVRWSRRKVLEWKTRKARDTFEIGFQTNSVLAELRLKLQCHRCMILVAHNGGGNITAQKPVYTSVRYQVSDPVLPNVVWRNEPPDDGYWRLLREIARLEEHRHLRIAPQALQEDSKLRALYESQGVRGAFVFPLFDTPSEFWYVSATFTEDFEGVTESEASETIRSAKARLVRHLRDLRVS